MVDPTADYLNTNRRSWDVRVDQHLDSAFYGVEAWLAGETSLKPIEMALLGDVSGARTLHLQCHFGQDSLSLARMGAEVTGLDLSPRAVEEARRLAERAGLAATFVEGDVYAAPSIIDGDFDLVFTSYGTIGWLPDIRRWAQVVAHFVRPGGRFVFAEFHPVLWMLDENFAHIKYAYAKTDAIVTEEGSYADVLAEAPQTFVGWNHGLAEVIGALLAEGLRITHFSEYDYSPFGIFGEHGVEVARGRHMLRGREGIIPLVYALVAEKPQ